MKLNFHNDETHEEQMLPNHFGTGAFFGGNTTLS
jgi:hypothetical protein